VAREVVQAVWHWAAGQAVRGVGVCGVGLGSIVWGLEAGPEEGGVGRPLGVAWRVLEALFGGFGGLGGVVALFTALRGLVLRAHRRRVGGQLATLRRHMAAGRDWLDTWAEVTEEVF
jgi:hypothetical protein